MATIVLATMDDRVGTILSAEMEGEGHQVRIAYDGQDAVDVTLAEKVALVILDASLPVFDGFEVADLLRGDPDVPKELPILLLSDIAVEPHRFERSGFTAQFPKNHAHQDVREMLTRYVNVVPSPP